MELPGFGEFDADDEKLREILSQMGVVFGPDGKPELGSLMGKIEQAMRTFQTQMAGYGESDPESGMNWGFVLDSARRLIASQPINTSFQVSPGQFQDALALADLWLDDEIAFPRVTTIPALWDRQTWLERTFPAWKQMLRPVLVNLSKALQTLIPTQAEELEQLGRPMLRVITTGALGTQVANSLSGLGTSVLIGSDVGLPLLPTAQIVLLPENIANFSDGLEQSTADVLLYLAIREVAGQRLFGANRWLGTALLAMVEHYAGDIQIDAGAVEESMRDALSGATSGTDFQNIQADIFETMFSPARTVEQDEILGRLETLLALIEGWVDAVVDQVTRGRMPVAAAFTETMRRRRATGGPAEHALKSLVGMELHPRRIRDAANLWAATRASRGTPERDAVWAHPDLLPTAAELADPLGFAEHGHQVQPDDDFDSALAKLLNESGN